MWNIERILNTQYNETIEFIRDLFYRDYFYENGSKIMDVNIIINGFKEELFNDPKNSMPIQDIWNALSTAIGNDEKLNKIRYDWLMKIGKEAVGDNSFVDFKNPSESDRLIIRKTVTYFEGDFDLYRKESLFEDWFVRKHLNGKETSDKEWLNSGLLFDPKNGSIRHPDKYEYMGAGMAMNKMTNSLFKAVIF